MLHSHLTCFKKICRQSRGSSKTRGWKVLLYAKKKKKKRCSGVLPYFLRVDWNTFPAVEALVFMCLRNPLILRE